MQNLLQIGLFKVLTTLPKFRTLGSSHSLSCPPCCVPASSGDSTPTNTVTYTSDSPACISPLFNLATPLLMQQSHPTLALKPLIPLLPTLYPLPHPDLMLLAVSLHLLLPLPAALFYFFGALNFYALFCLIPLTLFASRNLTLTHLPLSKSLDLLLCGLITPSPGLEFSLLMPRTLAAASSYLSGRANPSPNFTVYLLSFFS